jgi:hypothetical protein
MQFRIYAWHVRHLDRKDRVLIGLLTITLIAGPACATETARTTPSPTIAPSTAAASTVAPTPTRTTTPAPTTAPSSAAVVPPVTGSPRVTASTACPPLTGGSPLAAPRVASLRAAHNPGFDRLVIEFTEQAVPTYEIKSSSDIFGSPSGASVRVDGNAFFSIRVSGEAHTDSGQRSYPQADPYRPGLPLIREVKLITDFEGAVIFGVGLERSACPTLLVLASPPRIVLDFPTPP